MDENVYVLTPKQGKEPESNTQAVWDEMAAAYKEGVQEA